LSKGTDLRHLLALVEDNRRGGNARIGHQVFAVVAHALHVNAGRDLGGLCRVPQTSVGAHANSTDHAINANVRPAGGRHSGRWWGGEWVREISQQPEDGGLVLVAARVEVADSEGELVLLSVLVGSTSDIVGRRGIGVELILRECERTGVLRLWVIRQA
jgi:hypothetical protein